MKAYIVSLGCPKNLSDAEVLMGKLRGSGYQVIGDPKEADMIIVNTCAFLKSARDEAEAVIREMAGWKKKGKCRQLYVGGCLPKYLKTIDHRPPTTDYRKKHPYVDSFVDTIGLFSCGEQRVKATVPWVSYIKIAEGCNNHCSYCLIPKIRGRLRTRGQKDIINEVKSLKSKVERGDRVKDRAKTEVILIGQDTTKYPKLDILMRKLSKLRNVRWIRLMYTHPAHLKNEVIEEMARNKKVLHYIDLPIQHCNDRILASMNRKYNKKDIEKLVSRLRRNMPDICIRTSIIVGFPGEKEADYKELKEFVKKMRFDRLGVFPYSREKGTKAYEMKGQVKEGCKGERVKGLMKVQAKISSEINKGFVGKEMDVVVESRKSKVKRGEEHNTYLGRSYRDAPGIDGTVIVKSRKSKVERPGNIVKVRITKAGTYDLEGVVA